MLLGLVACSGGSGRSDGGDGGGDRRHFDDPTEAMLAIAEAVCQTAHACASSYAGMLPFELLFGATLEECTATKITSPEQAAELGQDVADGSSIFHAERADNCFAWLQDTDCTSFWEQGTDQACSGILTGTRPDGTDCTRDSQCASNYCDYIDFYCRDE